MNALQAMIAQGGTYESPVKRYMKVRQHQQAEAGNALNRQSAIQGMNMNALNMKATRQGMAQSAEAAKRAREVHYMNGLEQVGLMLKDVPLDEQPAALQKIPFAKLGLPQPSGDPVEAKVIADTSRAVYKARNQPKGDDITAYFPDQPDTKPFAAAVDEAGRIIDPITRKHIPGAIQYKVTAVVDDASKLTGVTNPEIAKARTTAQTTEENLRQVQTAVGSILTGLDDPNYVGGLAQLVINNIDSARSQIDALRNQDKDIGELIDTGKAQKEKDWIEKAAISGNRTDAAILEIAFLHAKVLNNSGKISDADVAYARQIVEGTANKNVKRALLMDLVNRAGSQYDDAMKANTGPGRLGDGFWRPRSDIGGADYMQGYQQLGAGQGQNPRVSPQLQGKISGWLQEE